MNTRSRWMTSALVAAAAACSAGPADDWKVGLQAWTLKDLTFTEVVEQSAALGLKHVESFPRQALGGGMEGTTAFAMDAATRAGVKAMLRKNGVRIANYGVIKAKGPDEWRALFDFAKDMGIETIVSEPEDADLDTVSKLCDEYGINLAIHNHPAPSKYWDPDTVLKAIEGRSRRMGACADTGHWLRSGLDPIECLKKLDGRIASLHLKDLPVKGEKAAKDVPWGTGVANVDGVLRELVRQKFSGMISIEYENRSETQLQEVEQCIAWLRTWIGRHGASTAAFTPDAAQTWSTVRPTAPADLWPAPPPPKPEAKPKEKK